MKTRPKLAAAIIAASAISFSLGALSESVFNQLVDELEFRSFRALAWKGMLVGLSKPLDDYFEGLSAGHLIARSHLLDGEPLPTVSPTFVMGVVEALASDQLLIDQTNKYGSIVYAP